MIKKKYFNYLLEQPLWLCLWSIVYSIIIVVGLFWPGSTILNIAKLAGIFSCLVFVLCYFKKDYLLQVAFLFTFAADIILTFNNVEVSGVLVFAMAQLAHFARLCSTKKMNLTWLCISCIALIIIYLLPINNRIVLAGTIYGITLLANFIICFYHNKHKPNRSSFCGLLGFGLFICCDLLVAISFFSTIGILPIVLKSFTDYACWLFYFPSQVLIANSSRTML